MDMIDLKSREIFSHEGRGVAALVEEPGLKIRQIGLEPGREVPLHEADAPVTIQVIHGEGLFTVQEDTIRMGPGKLLRIRMGDSMGILNDSTLPLVLLVIKTPLQDGPRKESSLSSFAGVFVSFIEFAPLKPGKEELFMEWFRYSSETFAKHPGFISRTLLGPIEGGNRYVAVIEHESKESFMDMYLSDDREQLFRQVEPLFLGESKPHFYETLVSHRRKK
jgi:quercetin dioxygenase-like cupin family protein/heme-degrading monooxygenase HmoA